MAVKNPEKSGWDRLKVSNDFRGGKCVIEMPYILSSLSLGFTEMVTPSSFDPRPTGLNFGQTWTVVSLWCKASLENLSKKCPGSHGKNASRHELLSFLVFRDLVHRQTACAAIKHMALGVAGFGCEDALTHLVNYVWPNIFETSPHVINAVMESIEGMRVALGPSRVLHYCLQVNKRTWYCSKRDWAWKEMS